MTSILSNLFVVGGPLHWDGAFLSYLSIAIGTLAISRLLFDTYYYLRVFSRAIISIVRYWVGLDSQSLGLLEEQETMIYCSTTDLDHMLHMNNSRYNRKCDFARYELLTKNHFLRVLIKHRVTFGLAATTIRFRKSINFLQKAVISSKIVYWDDRSFYVEQNFHRPSDSFVFATLYAKLTLVGANSEQMLEWLEFTGERPEPTEDLLSWIGYCEQSSARLRPKAS